MGTHHTNTTIYTIPQALSLLHSKPPSPSSSSSLSQTKTRRKKMCMSSAEWDSSDALFSSMRKQRSKRSKIRIHRLTRRKQRTCEDDKDEVDMELKNLKLYMKNISILEENDKLRKKASLLHLENLALLSEFHKKISSFDHHPIAIK